MKDQKVMNDPAAPKMFTKDQVRSKIFSAESKKPKSKTIKFFDMDIEIRQTTLTDMMDQGGEEGKNALIKALISSAYLPDTEEKVFEATDYEQLASLPYGDDFNRLLDCLKELRVINF